MVLTQEKLDVIVKKRSNLFNWRGQFTPEFVEYVLQNFSNTGDYILDPFSGSGTVLLESAKLNLQVTGFEINPAAYAMSKFFTFCNLPFPDRIEFANKFESKLNSHLANLNGQRVYSENPDYRAAYSNLLRFAETVAKQLTGKNERIFFLNILFQSEKDKSLTVRESIFKSFSYIKNIFLSLPFSDKPISASLNDARHAGDAFTNKIDLILTSPPYINVFNYHQNYRAIIEIFDFDVLKVAHSEFGSNRKNRGNRFKTVIQYCIDMEQSIRAFWNALKPNSRIVLVVGRESNVRGNPFYNGQMVVEILEQSNAFSDIKILERKFTNKFGNNIKEDIIIATKTGELTKQFSGRNIALKHLEKCLQTSTNDVFADITDAISGIDEIKASPFFNPKHVISNEGHK
jgi:DNA modification methylase